ncbi:RlpA-like double-psi beta-barrel domain-containing protein [Pontibacter aquaedesilientis]|nr:hypothetical protein [Pontibacter aquaedesilientis]
MITPREIKKVQNFPKPSETYSVTATVYYPEKGQTDQNPLITADGSRINPKNPKKHRWIALSRDMLARWGGDIQYGDTVWVRGISKKMDGMYIVRDTMNRRFRNRIDILVGRRDKIYGRWDDVEIAKAEFKEEKKERLDFKPSYYSLAMSH